MPVDVQTHGERHAAPNKTIAVRVRYLGARHPFEDPKAPAGENLAELKPRVLDFFKLKEGPVDGGTKVYVFAMDGLVLTDLNTTLGVLAKEHHELKLDLLERFEQG
ncbi:MAG: hypothetical protein JSR66_13170 [Proteobacteria bacterium]|nr:hypothetical protein [Pseudomonadota bacterium]